MEILFAVSKLFILGLDLMGPLRHQYLSAAVTSIQKQDENNIFPSWNTPGDIKGMTSLKLSSTIQKELYWVIKCYN